MKQLPIRPQLSFVWKRFQRTQLYSLENLDQEFSPYYNPRSLIKITNGYFYDTKKFSSSIWSNPYQIRISYYARVYIFRPGGYTSYGYTLSPGETRQTIERIVNNSRGRRPLHSNSLFLRAQVSLMFKNKTMYSFKTKYPSLRSTRNFCPGGGTTNQFPICSNGVCLPPGWGGPCITLCDDHTQGYEEPVLACGEMNFDHVFNFNKGRLPTGSGPVVNPTDPIPVPVPFYRPPGLFITDRTQ